MPKKIILIRHGETDYNKKGLAQGWVDTDLSLKGLSQAKKVAKRLEKEIIHAIYSSDLKRAHETGNEIGKLTGKKPKKTKDLRERDLGVFEEKSWKDIQTKMTSLYEGLRKTDDMQWKEHKGESRGEVRERLSNVLRHLSKKHKNENIVITTHGGAKRQLLRLMGLFDATEYIPVDNTSVTVLEKSKNGKYKITMFNDTSHLED
ncbi:histidine phosphatase family protein [Patescibacteria group bacterium]